MFKRLFFVVLMVLTSISTGFLATAAQASTNPAAEKTVRGVFDISSLDADHQLLVEEALACDDFDYSMLRRSLKKKTGRTAIKLEVKDISKWGAVGVAWQTGLLQIDDDVKDPRWFQQVVMHEIGHMVDFYYLMPNKLHGPIAKLYGAPWSTMGHDFNGGFTGAFSCFDAGDANGYLDEAGFQALRALMGGEGLIPAKTM